MIAIFSKSEEILKYLPQIGLGRHQIRWNPPVLTGITCIVQVGGYEVDATHCYIQQENGIPYIQCISPDTVRLQPQNKVWILCALEKAKRIAFEGLQRPNVEIIIRPSMKDVENFIADIEGILSFDIETDRHQKEILTFGLAFRKGDKIRAISVPVATEQHDYWNEEEEAKIWLLIAGVLSDARPKLFQNFIFDTMVLSYYGVETKGDLLDTMTAAHLLSPELPKGLEDLGRLFLMVEVWKRQQSWVSNESLWRYNAKDAAYTYLIYEAEMEALSEQGQREFFDKHLTPLSHEVLRLCERGWVLDNEALETFRSELRHKTGNLLKDLQAFANDFVRTKVTFKWAKQHRKRGLQYWRGVGSPAVRKEAYSSSGEIKVTKLEYADYEKVELPETLGNLKKWPEALFEKVEEKFEFNPDSPYNVRDVLLAWGVRIPTKNGKETTNEVHLLRLIESPRTPPEVKEFLRQLLEYRGAAKMLGTYAEVRADNDGRVRFSITIPGTVESRFSSKQTPWDTGLNSQNVPKEFRRIIIPSTPGWKIVSMDFKQADPHMVAWLSGCDEMLKILNDPKGDLHAHTASGIFGYDITQDEGYDKGTSQKRALGKACNNGLNYGMQPVRFVETCRKQGLSVSVAEAQAAYAGYFGIYPHIREWQNSIRVQINRTRTLRTPLGRSRYFYGFINEKLYNDAFSYIAPTTVADCLNIGWLKVERARGDLSFNVLAQVHDSLVLECPSEEVAALVDLMRKCYSEVTFTTGNYNECCFPVEFEVGESWGTVKKYE